jgi:hypothetical protein
LVVCQAISFKREGLGLNAGPSLLLYFGRGKNMLFYERKKAPETRCLFLFCLSAARTGPEVTEGKTRKKILKNERRM